MIRNQKKYELRPCRESDLEFLKQVFASSRQRIFAAANLPALQRQMLLEHQFNAQDSSYRAQNPEADWSLILVDGEPAGRFYIARRPGEISLLEMTLLPRFQNQGVGTALIQDLLDEAGAGGKSVVLYVEHWNPDARRLYQRLGFRNEEDLETHWRLRWTGDGGA